MNRKLWLGLAVSAVFLWLSIRNVDLVQAWAYMQNIEMVYLIPSVILVGIEALLRAFKWQILLLPLKRCSFWKLNSATLIGLMANNVLPARAGEFVRAYAGARLADVPYSTAFATVVIDRVLDGLTVSALFIAVLIFQPLIIPEPPDWLNRAGYITAGIYLVTLAFLIGLIVARDRTLALARMVLQPFPGADSRRRLERSLPCSSRDWVCSGACRCCWPPRSSRSASGPCTALRIYLMFLMFHMSLSIFQSFVTLLILTIVLTAPAQPGFVGAMELGIKVSLVIFGVSDTQAFALAAVYHVMQYIPVTAAGLIALWKERLTMAEIASAGPSAPGGKGPEAGDVASSHAADASHGDGDGELRRINHLGPAPLTRWDPTVSRRPTV